MIGIYKIKSPSGRVYIGQSWNVEKRLSGYKQPNYKSSQTKLIRSLRKYGYSNHDVQIIVIIAGGVTQEQLDYYEILCIQTERNWGSKLLNIKEGGSRGKNSEETRRKISAARRADKTKRTLKPEHIEAIKLHNRGKKHTLQTRLNMSNAQKAIGHLNSQRTSKPIIQCAPDGSFIKEWGSLTKAAEGVGLKTPSAICTSARSDYRLAKGFRWKYKNQ